MHPPAAAEAIAGGFALPLLGGPAAFTLVRDAASGVIRPAVEMEAALDALTARPVPWAGLPQGRPLVMGVLNVTPDSFSDGGRNLEPEAAIAAGKAMMAAGADLLDVGGETTRPRAAPTPQAEECARVLPVVAALAGAGFPVSIDTRHAATMRAALGEGARIVNDVSALTHDPEAMGVVAASGAPVILMHMRGQPATMHDHADYADVAREVCTELAARVAAAEAAGVARAAIAVDPGIGFAKFPPDNLALLRRLPLLLSLGRPLVVGVSRKRFIGLISGVERPEERVAGSVAAALHAALHGAAILRVHDVPATVQAVRVWRALLDGAEKI